MKKRCFRFLHIAAALFLTLGLGRNGATLSAQELAPAQILLDAMTVEERVGQLFLVTFRGNDIRQSSDIADLVLNYRVGGVVLLAENDNISDLEEDGSTPLQVARLTNDLQQLAITGVPITATENLDFDASELGANLPTAVDARVPVPLFVAANHEGDGYPHSSIISGLTEIPNSMAIGATWQPEYGELVGEIAGREMSAIGVNMLLGPSLDVLDNPEPLNPADLGTRTFGGDPYWVGLMGRSYIVGAHRGSNDRLAVIAKHFPGNGSSDRPVDIEVPTVRKSLEQLKQIELAPFLAVTEATDDPNGVADGFLTTHIRYQGFQGNIRATTNPISFDRQALATLMGLTEFTTWRQGGGIIVSDALGVRSIERFYDDTEQEFPHRRVAKDALLAGNDLLYVADFALGEGRYEAHLENIKDTVQWFREIYETDQPFQQRVDEAVRRIIQLKLKLYGGDFSLSSVQVDLDEITSRVAQDEAAMLDLARAAITLVSPSPAELAERLVSPPGVDDRIIVFTDVRNVRQCSECPLSPLISLTALEERILALYGPEASEQVQASQISSFSLDDLEAFLDAGSGPILLPPTPAAPASTPTEDASPAPDLPTPTPLPTPTLPPGFLVQQAFIETDWIIFATLGSDPQEPVLSRFLAERPDIVRNTNVIVFAYGAPYYLDTTEISKLTAFYAVYSKTGPFVDASVRAMFQESLLSGVPPVDIEGANYDLFTRTQPDPTQVIELSIVAEGGIQAPPREAPLEASIGDTLRLQAGVIRDRNGNHVPDGTLVQFIQQDRIQGVVSIIADVPTSKGVAQLDYVLEARTGAGQFRITARAGEAIVSQEVDISIEEAAQVAIITPTPMPTATTTSTATATSTASSTPSPTPSPSQTPTIAPVPPVEPGVRIELSEFQTLVAIIMGMLIVGNIGLSFGHRQHVNLSKRIGWPLWGLIGGLLLYIYYALGLPGTDLLADTGGWAGLLTTLAGGLIGLFLFQIGLWLERWRGNAGR